MHVRIDVPANPEGARRITREERIVLVVPPGDGDSFRELDSGGFEVDVSRICRIATIRFASREIATATVDFLAIEIGHTTKL